MKSLKNKSFYGLLAIVAMFTTLPSSQAEKIAGDDTVPVSMTVTASVAGGKRVPNIAQNEIQIRRGKERLQVTNWVPAQGDHAGLDLFILIDDASDPVLGLQLDDLRNFINAQPSTTKVGVGYMRNATIQIAQNFTTEHAAAAAALRLPTGIPSAYGSPYRSVADLMKRWPDSGSRREVLMMTDGIDRISQRGFERRGYYVNPVVDVASSIAQKTGTMIHTIYAPSSSRFRRSYWERTNGQMNAVRLSDETGGESYYLGLHSPVSIAPYLAELQGKLENQYILSFSAKPGKKAELQSVRLSTEIAGVELASHNAVWVPASR